MILDAVRYMTHHAVESAEEKFRKLYIVQWLLARGDKDMAKRMAQEKQKDVQIWTSTSSFTDAVLRSVQTLLARLDIRLKSSPIDIFA